MVHKETPLISVNNHLWAAGKKPNSSEENLLVLPGMVAGWYFDGEKCMNHWFYKNQELQQFHQNIKIGNLNLNMGALSLFVNNY